MRIALPRTLTALTGLTLLTLGLAACSGDDTATTDTLTGESIDPSVGPSTSNSTTSASTTANTDGTTTAGTMSGTDSTTTSTSETGTDSDTTATSGPVTSTDPTTTTDPTTGPDCICEAGQPSGQCVDGGVELCADDCKSYVTQACPQGQSCQGGACIDQICAPGATQCVDNDTFETCSVDGLAWEPTDCGVGQSCKDGACIDLLCTPNEKACLDAEKTQTCSNDGQSWLPPVNCGNTEGCNSGQCIPLCDLVQLNPSSIGCSFTANRMDNYYANENDSIVVGNISKSKTVSVQLYRTPTNSNTEQAQGAAVNIPPGGTTTFTLTEATIDKVSRLRQGGSYRIQSNLPVIAYQHSPLGQIYTNDASMLLPDYALKQNYVVASWRDALGSYPSYFNVVAIQNNTVVKWTPPIATLAGTGVPAVAANATGQVTMNRADTLQVRVANSLDISGTLIEADKPIWVVGATECTNVPNNSCLYCDHVEDMMLPLDYWGKEYVGAPSPKRGNEKHHWRVFAGDDNITITTEPAQAGTPIVLAKKGQFKDIQTNNSVRFVFKSDKPFMPVQYLESQTCGANTGDPAMYQMIPVEQFLPSYAFATGTGNYPLNYVQIIRQKDGAAVTVDGVTVTGYYTVGNYEVSDWKINLGSHFAESAQPFGIVGVGYSDATSYAYPGGLQLKEINPQ